MVQGSVKCPGLDSFVGEMGPSCSTITTFACLDIPSWNEVLRLIARSRYYSSKFSISDLFNLFNILVEGTNHVEVRSFANLASNLDQLNAEAESVQIILTGIDNDIYSTVDACPNACECGKPLKDKRLKIVSYHKLYDILKQHHNEVNKIRAERLARTANPLALIDKLIGFNFSSRLRKFLQTYQQQPSTSSNIRRANLRKSPRINRGTGYDNQRAVNVAGARENVGTPVVQKSGIQCYNCKEYGHVSRECQKPKRVNDAAYHKEKMLLCKQEEAGVKLNGKTS
ncbi:gag-pol polyprotein [Tanacetum coccineum]